MGRKVSVSLVADILGFVRPVDSAKRAVDDLGDKVDKLDRELDKIPPDAAKAAAALKLLGGSLDEASVKFDSISDKQTKLAALDSQISKTRTEVRKLSDEFTKTGDVEVFKKLGDAQGRLSALSKIRKGIASSVEDGAREGFLKGMSSTLSNASFGQVAAGVGAALAVPLIAAVGGALAGAVGFGIAGAGLAGAILGDPQKAAASWKSALGQVKAEFVGATKPYTDELYAAIGGIGPMVKSWHLDKIFKDALPYVQPLIRGVEGFATNIVGGISKLIAKGGPAVDALSDGMVTLGRAAASAFSDIADGADGGAMALHDTINAVATLIEAFGKLTYAAEKSYKFIRENDWALALPTFGTSLLPRLFDFFNGDNKDAAKSQEELRKQAQAAAKAAEQAKGPVANLKERMDLLSGSMLDAATKAGSLAAAIDKVTGAAFKGEEAELHFQAAIDKAAESLDKNGKNLDANTEKGRANRQALLDLAKAGNERAAAIYDTTFAAEGEAAAQDAATRAAHEARDAYVKQAMQMGYTRQEAEKLAWSLIRIPGEKKIEVDINTIPAKDRIAELKASLAGITDKTITIKAKADLPSGISMGYLLHHKHGGIRKAQRGMIVPESSPGTLIAEPGTGGEANIPLKGISQARAMDLTKVVADSYGFSIGRGRQGGVAAVDVRLSSGDALIAALMPHIRTEIRTMYGGNVQAALGSS